MVYTENTTIETVEAGPVVYKAKPYVVTDQVLNFIFYLIEGFLLLRFILQATGANPWAGFVNFVYTVSEIFMLPFRFIFPETQTGVVVIEWSVLVAMLVYGLFYFTLRKAMKVAYTAENM